MKKTSILITVLILWLTACAQDYSGRYAYQAPEQMKDGLIVGTIEEAKIDVELLGEAVERIRAGKYREVHSLLIYKDGKLVVEEYFSGHRYQWDGRGHRGEFVEWQPYMTHHVQSVTKSVTSACIGIAIDKGFIKSVDQSIFDYLPDHMEFKNNGREKITIEHLLTMTPGFSWVEWGTPYSSRKNPVVGIWFSDKDPVSFILDTDIIHEPGTHYEYYGGSQVLLGEILRNATGMYIDEFSKKYLFEPLEDYTADWAVRHDNGVIEAAGGLKISPRGMLKFGVTFLNDGVWNEELIVSKNWVKKSSVSYNDDWAIDVPGSSGKDMGYSYCWWIPYFDVNGDRISAFGATGWGGQKIYVVPDLETVVVFTGGNFTSGNWNHKVMEKFILPAIIGSN